ncbi:MAG: lipoprotein-releasing ABC transporter permease subunit [Gammaproteobacteria bacterium]|nr:lipoprotein-releasing ABC transporter permease subunit [Gammaproteobacteria bacterium]
MYKPISLFIGMRYLRAKRRSSFISFISMVTILGLAIGTSVLILVLSVMNGFSREINSRILGAVPHVTMQSRLPLMDWQEYSSEIKLEYEVEAAVPFVRLEGMLSANGRAEAALISGIDPVYEKDATIVDDFMQIGDLTDLQPGEFSIVLGNILAASLGVGVGDELVMVIPQITTSPLGTLPRLRRFTVSGLYALGSEIDANVAFVHINDAAAMKKLGDAVEGIRLNLADVFDAPVVGQLLAREYDDFYVSDWTATYGNLFASIRLEKRLVGLLLFLIIAVASFNMVSALVMLVNDKKDDIAILRTMGANRGMIIGIFMANGTIAGLVGTGSGVIAGVILALYISEIVAFIEQLFVVDFLSADTYFIDFLPSHLLWSDVFLVAAATLTLSSVASIYPALRAGDINPVESLRHE